MSTSRMSPDSGPFDHAHPEVQSQKYVVFVDLSRRYIYCSDEVCDLLGYGKDEILGKTIDDLSYIHSDVLPLFERFVQNGALDGEYLLQHKTGRMVSIRYHAWVFADGCLAAVWQPAERWKQLYHTALLEMDRDRLKNACEGALAAIAERQLELAKDDPLPLELCHEMNDAATILRRLLTQR